MVGNPLLLGCQKYSLALKARTGRKRVAEAEKALGSLYPFEIKSRNILIDGKGKKGVYDVYVSRTEIKKPRHGTRAAVPTAVFLLSLSTAFFMVRHKLQESKNIALAEKEHDRVELERIRMQKEKEERVDALRKEYGMLKTLQYERIYPRMEHIYSAMTKGTIIENISIEKTSFAIEVSTDDAMEILRNFEENAAFEFIKMTRASVTEGKETVTYAGTFSDLKTDDTKFFSADDELEFYEKKIAAIKGRRETLRNTSLSEYIRNIRNLLHENDCHEQYIQLHGNGSAVEVEFYVLSSSKNILNFINKLQDSDARLVDIKQLRIRNSEQQDRMQTVLFFDTGIDLRQAPKEFAELTEKRIPVAEISELFYKKSSPKDAVKSQQRPTVQTDVSPRERKGMKSLAYIGLTKIGGKVFVLAKDEEMNAIYKLPISGMETDGDYCEEASGGFHARIRGEYYEVKK